MIGSWGRVGDTWQRWYADGTDDPAAAVGQIALGDGRWWWMTWPRGALRAHDGVEATRQAACDAADADLGLVATAVAPSQDVDRDD